MKLPEGAVLLKTLETKKYIINLYEHRVGDSIVDGDRFVVKVSKETGEESLSEDNKWADIIPPPKVAKPPQGKRVLVDPDDPFYVWYKKPKKYQLCWFIWEGSQLTIKDEAGEVIGQGTPPPSDKALSMLAGPWEAHMESAGYWFTKMGFETAAIGYSSSNVYPKELIESTLADPKIKCVFQIAHGSNTWSGIVTAGQVRECLENREKMCFAFMGQCGGMCGVDGGAFSNAYRKGSMVDTFTVGYCGMSSRGCAAAWGKSIQWQNKLFQHIYEGMMCGDAFEESIADYPECEGCMVFHGDENFILKPVDGHKDGMVMFPAYQEIWSIEDEYKVIVKFQNLGETPITATVPWSARTGSVMIDQGDLEIIYLSPGIARGKTITVANPRLGESTDVELLVKTQEMEGRCIVHFSKEGGEDMANISHGITIELEPVEGEEKIYDVRVTVNKKFTRDPIVGASVSLAGQGTNTTDSEGKCYFPNVAAGTHDVSVSCDGYKSVSITITLAV